MLEAIRENDILTIKLPERVDASNAAEVEADVDSVRNHDKPEIVVFDADELTYISSAGLRIIIKVVKREQSASVINVCPEVYEIFEVSGFTKFIRIERKA